MTVNGTVELEQRSGRELGSVAPHLLQACVTVVRTYRMPVEYQTGSQRPVLADLHDRGREKETCTAPGENMYA